MSCGEQGREKNGKIPRVSGVPETVLGALPEYLLLFFDGCGRPNNATSP